MSYRCGYCAEPLPYVDDILRRLAAAERELEETRAAMRSDAGELWETECMNARQQRDESLEKLAVAVEALDSAHNALDQATYRSVVGADVGAEALNAVRETIARIRGDKR